MLGAATVLLYAATATWMVWVARRNPARVFQIGRYGRIRRRDVTAAQWIHRYLPWGLGAGLVLVILGLFILSRPR